MNILLQFLDDNWKWIVAAAGGYSGGLFQDWLVFRRGKKSGLQQKKENIIEEVFLLTRYFDATTACISQMIIYLKTEGQLTTSPPENSETTAKDLERLNYLLEIELNAPKELLDFLHKFEEYKDNALRIVFIKPGIGAGLISNKNETKQLVDKVFQGDYIQGAYTFYESARQTGQEIKEKIKIFLSSEKDKIR